jgi:hypothetical protein
MKLRAREGKSKREIEREKKNTTAHDVILGGSPGENIFLMNSAISLSGFAQYRISPAFVQYRTYKEAGTKTGRLYCTRS